MKLYLVRWHYSDDDGDITLKAWVICRNMQEAIETTIKSRGEYSSMVVILSAELMTGDVFIRSLDKE